jgi:hypothetical protein
MLAVGVGHNEHALSHVWCTNGARRNNRPLRIIPEAGQVSENNSHSVIEQRCDVLHDRVTWSYLANEPGNFSPEARSLSIKAGPSPSSRYVLAREATTDDVNGNSVSSKSVGCEFSNVIVAGHLGPVFREHAAGVVLDFAEGDSLKAARALQTKAESRRCPKKDQAL